jgi:hypothetical protein
MSARTRTAAKRPPSAPDQALRAAGRKPWDKVLAWLRKQAETADPAPFARELLAEFRRFEVGLAPEEQELIANPLLWNDAEREFGAWVESSFHAFSRISATALRRLCDGGPGSIAVELAASMACLSLATSGAAIKWAEIAGTGRRVSSLVEIHRAYLLAEEQGLQEAAAPLPNGAGETTLSVRAHYARVLLLDAFCRGNLSRQQVAIADCWLIEWCPHYSLVDGRCAGAGLAVDCSSSRGIRAAPFAPVRGARTLAIEPMAAQIDEVVHWFHQGRIFPGRGAATTFRVEEHVAVLDFLRRFLRAASRDVAPRQQRDGREVMVEIHVGLAEILAKGFAPMATEGPAIAKPREPAGVLPGASRTVTEMQYEVSQRSVRLVDESAGGLGFEADDGEHPLEVGTLIAARRDPGKPPVLCEIARRVCDPGSKTRLGARVLSRDMKKLALARSGAKAGVQGLFLPGADSSGRGDAVVVAQSDFDPHALLEIHYPDRVYVVRLNRIRHLGRGWVLAGLEVVEEQARTAPDEITFAV